MESNLHILKSMSRGQKWLMFAPPECKTPEFLYESIQRNDIAMVDRVIHNFPATSAEAIKALELAVSLNNEDCVGILISYGVSPFSEDNHIVNLAKEKDFKNIIEMFEGLTPKK
jgi:hypothetical protein